MIHLDYRPVPECTNPDSFGEVCVKCNECGRFTRNIKCLNCGQQAEHILGVTWPPGWEQVELYDSLQEPICPQCVPFFSEQERDPALPQVIRAYKADFQRREEDTPCPPE